MLQNHKIVIFFLIIHSLSLSSLQPNMASPLSLSLILFFFFLFVSASLSSSSELDILLDIKSSLDPEKRFLTSWTPDADPCSSGSFDGVACDENHRVANISLQGMGLTGTIPPSIGLLTSLTGLYLHFNSLTGHIPKDISNLPLLTDLYLNVNNLSGEIPPQIGNLGNLQGRFFMHVLLINLTHLYNSFIAAKRP